MFLPMLEQSGEQALTLNCATSFSVPTARRRSILRTARHFGLKATNCVSIISHVQRQSARSPLCEFLRRHPDLQAVGKIRSQNAGGIVTRQRVLPREVPPTRKSNIRIRRIWFPRVSDNRSEARTGSRFRTRLGTTPRPRHDSSWPGRAGRPDTHDGVATFR